jgi:hypothetical protein
MGTSASPEWTARAHVFSGRPDPRWLVPSDVAARLVAPWNELPEASEEHGVSPPALGYRGVSLHQPDGNTWLAFGGYVRRTSDRGIATHRDDEGAWERALLATAPPGTLPPPLGAGSR